MNEFGYTKAQGIELLDTLLLPKGYEKVAEKNEPKWFKIYDCDILSTCEGGEYIECNNGFEEKDDADVYLVDIVKLS